MMANRLAGETSPYLLQHADNPVDWFPWGEEALNRARELDRPILLSIGYSACHWCHVMERESFEDPETAAYMNANFVCIKVDREERPDVDDVYMEAVQGMTGQGGWPLTAILDTETVPFYGGTYFPPEPRHGMPSFRMVLEAVVGSWASQRQEIAQASERIKGGLAAAAQIDPSDAPLDPGMLDAAVASLAERADRRFGGFGGAPKFPPASAVEFLLARGESEISAEALDAMARGGINDQLAGGFARYSVDARWLVPHFEKMLYDNALLARAYLHGFQALGHERWRATCEATLDWMLAEMRGPEGGFYSALDADSEGVEGRFYVWSAEEIREVLAAGGISEADAEAVIAWWGVSEEGNFEGSNVLNVPAAPGAEPPAALEPARAALLQRRSSRVRPGLDDKRICSWNALALAALADAGAVLGREDYLDAARACAGFILDRMRNGEGRLLRSWKDEEARIPAYLEDHAYLVEALLVLYESTFEQRWFDEAESLAQVMIERFSDGERGGFYISADDSEQLLARRKDADDHPIPSGNSAAAYALMRLAALTGDHAYEERAVGVFRLHARIAELHPQAVGHLLRALDLYLSPTREVALIAAGDIAELGPLAAVVRAGLRPHLVLAGGVEGASTPPLLRDRPTLAGKPAAYVCEGFACRAPVADGDDLAAALG
jgi:uncharacterized protein YyaL (SSP411 family)